MDITITITSKPHEPRAFHPHNTVWDWKFEHDGKTAAGTACTSITQAAEGAEAAYQQLQSLAGAERRRAMAARNAANKLRNPELLGRLSAPEVEALRREAEAR